MPVTLPVHRKSTLRWPGWYPLLIVLMGTIAIVFLYFNDPESSAGFLPCPFRAITGLLCPGCGAQRALHDLLHGRFIEAFQHNAILVTSIPLLGLQWTIPRLLRTVPDPTSNNTVVYLWLILLLGWGIARNVMDLAHHH